MVTPAAALEAVAVGRRYDGVVALEDVSLALRAGETTCLLGENGAGKSTLVRILTGVERPGSGEVRVDGLRVDLGSPAEARACGIAAVHQDLALVPLLPVWRNFALGAEPVRGRRPLRRLDADRARREARDELATMGLEIDPDRPVGTLSGGERQAVAIARALHRGARALVLDEPTAALAARQAAIVLAQVARAKARGAAILLVTHDPRAAAAAGDRFVVLSHGRVAAVLERSEATAEGLAEVLAGC